ncbi:hypothetical protein PoB_001875300 [Plakobranchus ocellatus]|uniref:Uncharacterized protein n=1 Tax=Plakobranchus ocellatus TaxID=259542 RepID=A0AAV3ZCD6_9GAST|nr:hypothetical protein PoB_001875300 [Plakobranchus ocellatus]
MKNSLNIELASLHLPLCLHYVDWNGWSEECEVRGKHGGGGIRRRMSNQTDASFTTAGYYKFEESGDLPDLQIQICIDLVIFAHINVVD